MRKKINLIVAIILFCAALTSCSYVPDNSGETASVVVGFSQLGAESSWRIANTDSMEKAAKEAGFGLMMENANQKQDKQIDAIRSFIAYQVDVIVFSPIVENGWDNVLSEAKKAGIPVILMDRMIETTDESLYTSYVGADFYAEGRRAGEYLVRKADSMNAEHMNIVEISGTLDSTPMRDRQKGFMDVIDKDPRFTILESICGDFLRSKGEECMLQLLERYGKDGIDARAVYSDAERRVVTQRKEKQKYRMVKDEKGIDPFNRKTQATPYRLPVFFQSYIFLPCASGMPERRWKKVLIMSHHSFAL